MSVTWLDVTYCGLFFVLHSAATYAIIRAYAKGKRVTRRNTLLVLSVLMALAASIGLRVAAITTIGGIWLILFGLTMVWFALLSVVAFLAGRNRNYRPPSPAGERKMSKPPINRKLRNFMLGVGAATAFLVIGLSLT